MPDTYVENLHAKSFRGFVSLDVQFNSQFNVLTGPNGSGKSTILRAITAATTEHNFGDVRVGADFEVWIDVTVGGELLRLGHGTGSITTSNYRNTNRTSIVDPPHRDTGRTLNPYYLSQEILNGTLDFRPLAISAYRNIEYVQSQGLNRAPTFEERFNDYRGRLPFVAGGSISVKQWLINRYFIIDKEWATAERKNWDWFTSCLGNFAPDEAKFSFVMIGADLEPQFEAYGAICYLEELSAGFQATLSLVVSIMDWIETTKSNGLRLAKDATGVVLIDELDVHLHPEWQQKIRSALLAVFPSLQFIVTSHSPHIVASCGPSEVIRIPSGFGRVEVRPMTTDLSLWGVDAILSDVFSFSDDERFIADEVLGLAETALELRDFELFDQQLAKMREMLHPSDPLITALMIRKARTVLESQKDFSESD